MRVLLLGGTVFLGKHIAEEALKQGMELTLFNRGKTNPVFLKDVKGVTHIVGDRSTNDIEKLTANWDVVIDLSGTDPKDVQRSVNQLKDRCKTYIFISSINAYKNPDKGPVLETSALQELDKDDYGSNKATSEVIVNNTFNDQSLIIRPGLIVGPDDPTDRFTYWPWVELPFWLPDSLNMNGMMHVSNDKVIKAGLRLRPLKDTINDTLEWSLNTRKGKWQAGLEREKELRVLEVAGNRK